MVLRIRGTSRHGQIVRLRSEKCTIGSGPRCTLRLRARGVRPLHCLIVHGPGTTVVRRWHPDTRLNGRAFSEAALVPGDRLSVGPIEFEVLQSIPSFEPPTPASPLPMETDGAASGPLDEELRELQQRKEALGRWEHDLEAVATRLNQREQSLADLAARLEARQQEIEARQPPHDDPPCPAPADPPESQPAVASAWQEIEAQRAELAAQQAELEAQRRALEEQRGRWEAERDEVERKFQARLEEFQAHRSELEAARQALAEQRRREAEFETRQRAFEEQRRQWETERDRAERDLASRQEALDARQAELEQATRELEEQRRRWEAEREEACRVDPRPFDTPGAEPPASGGEGPASVQDLLRRMGVMPTFSESDEDEPTGLAAKPRSGAFRGGESPPRSPKEEEEESIDEYMARLLQRVRSVTSEFSESSESSPAPRRADPSASRRSAPAESSPEATGPRSGPPKRREPVELSPRAVAPERKVNLTAMRELANLSAQTAIDHHTRRTLRRLMTTKLVVTIVALVASGALLWMWNRAPTRLCFSAAMASLVVAMFWGIQYLVLLTQRLRGRPALPERPRGDASRPEETSSIAEVLLAEPVEGPPDAGEPRPAPESD